MMNDRHLIGDVALAVLIAFPTLAIARPQPNPPQQHTAVTPLVQKAALAEATTAERRVTLPA